MEARQAEHHKQRVDFVRGRESSYINLLMRPRAPYSEEGEFTDPCCCVRKMPHDSSWGRLYLTFSVWRRLAQLAKPWGNTRHPPLAWGQGPGCAPRGAGELFCCHRSPPSAPSLPSTPSEHSADFWPCLNFCFLGSTTTISLTCVVSVISVSQGHFLIFTFYTHLTKYFLIQSECIKIICLLSPLPITAMFLYCVY